MCVGVSLTLAGVIHGSFMPHNNSNGLCNLLSSRLTVSGGLKPWLSLKNTSHAWGSVAGVTMLSTNSVCDTHIHTHTHTHRRSFGTQPTCIDALCQCVGVWLPSYDSVRACASACVRVWLLSYDSGKCISVCVCVCVCHTYRRRLGSCPCTQAATLP